MDVPKEILDEILKDMLPNCNGYMYNRYSSALQVHYWNHEPSIYTTNITWDKIYSAIRKKKLNKIKKSINARLK